MSTGQYKLFIVTQSKCPACKILKQRLPNIATDLQSKFPEPVVKVESWDMDDIIKQPWGPTIRPWINWFPVFILLQVKHLETNSLSTSNVFVFNGEIDTTGKTTVVLKITKTAVNINTLATWIHESIMAPLVRVTSVDNSDVNKEKRPITHDTSTPTSMGPSSYRRVSRYLYNA